MSYTQKKHNILSTDFFECNVETYDCVDINLKPVNNITLKELEKFEFNGLDFDGYFSRLGFNSKGCIYEIINGFTIENNWLNVWVIVQEKYVWI